MKDVKKIGSFSRLFRMYMLDETLEDLSKKYNVSVQSISAFEHGKSSNIKFLLMYYEESKNIHADLYYLKGVFE